MIEFGDYELGVWWESERSGEIAEELRGGGAEDDRGGGPVDVGGAGVDAAIVELGGFETGLVGCSQLDVCLRKVYAYAVSMLMGYWPLLCYGGEARTNQ